MNRIVRAQADTTEGLAQAFGKYMNEFGWLRSGPGALKRVAAYPAKARRALRSIDVHMTPCILEHEVHDEDLGIWSARLTDCRQRLDRTEDLLKGQDPLTDGWDEILAAIALTEATIVGALATLSIHGITLRIQPRLPNRDP